MFEKKKKVKQVLWCKINKNHLDSALVTNQISKFDHVTV